MICLDVVKVDLVHIIRYTEDFGNVARPEVEILLIHFLHVVPLIHLVQSVVELPNFRKRYLGFWGVHQGHFPLLCLDELEKTSMVLI